MGGRLCVNGNCVARILWCNDDRVDNCGDGTDEDREFGGACIDSGICLGHTVITNVM